MLDLYLNPNVLEAGCDEAGRGCLAGPVFAAAVILPSNFECPDLNDSKKLSERKRKLLRPIIEEQSISFAVGIVDNTEIDKINILNASFLAMHRAIDMLKVQPNYLLIDGNRFNRYKSISHSCIIGGDAKFQSIAAASILAKTYRDDYMESLDLKYPMYDWKKNKGYPTIKHRIAIQKYGITAYHRKSFNLKYNQLSIEF